MATVRFFDGDFVSHREELILLLGLTGRDSLETCCSVFERALTEMS